MARQRETITFRVPPGTKDRINRLLLPGEYQADILLLGLDLLEREREQYLKPAAPDAEVDSGTIDRLEAMVAELASKIEERYGYNI